MEKTEHEKGEGAFVRRVRFLVPVRFRARLGVPTKPQAHCCAMELFRMATAGNREIEQTDNWGKVAVLARLCMHGG